MIVNDAFADFIPSKDFKEDIDKAANLIKGLVAYFE